MGFRPLRPPGPWREELIRFAATLPPGSIMAEIGTFAGESAEIFVASGKVRRLYCIDPWNTGPETFPPREYMDEAEAAFDARHLRGCFKLKMMSPQAAALLADGLLDAIYIDADHRYESVRSDLLAFRPKVKRGGIIAGHDWWIPDVRRAIKEIMGGEPQALYRDGCPDGTWVYR